MDLVEDGDAMLTKRAVTWAPTASVSARAFVCLHLPSYVVTSHLISSHTLHCIRSLRRAAIWTRWRRLTLSHLVRYHECK